MKKVCWWVARIPSVSRSPQPKVKNFWAYAKFRVDFKVIFQCSDTKLKLLWCVSGHCPYGIFILLSLWYSFNWCVWNFFKVNFETFNYKNISKGWRLISTCCSIISKQSSSDQLDNQLSRWSLWLLGYSSFFSSDLLFTVGPSSKGSTPLTFGVQRFLRPWLIF